MLTSSIGTEHWLRCRDVCNCIKADTVATSSVLYCNRARWFSVNLIVQLGFCCESSVCVCMEYLCGPVCVCMQGMWRQASVPPWVFSLITQRSQPTPGHFLTDLPEESRACWATDHTCWSQTISLPVPVWERHTERNIEPKRVLASICRLLCSLPPLSRSLSVSRSYSFASWLFTAAQPALLQDWEQNTHWPSFSKFPPTCLCIKTWVIWASIKFEWGRFSILCAPTVGGENELRPYVRH